MKRPALVAVLLLAGCASVPGTRPAITDVAPPAQFHFAATASTAADQAQLLPQSDPAYRVLIGWALTDAPSLEEALARVALARAQSDAANAERRPALDYSGNVTGTRSNPDQFGSAGQFIERERASFGANLTARWDPDLFGALKASSQAARARLDAATLDAAAVRLALAAELAGSVIDWRTLERRELSLSADLAAARDLVRLSAARERAGIAPGFDRLRVEAIVASSEARMAALSGEKARLAARVTTLTARPVPQVLAALAQVPPAATPASASASSPAQVLQNRPDIASAASRLTAANADLASAAAQRFPKFNLSANLGLLAFGLDSLISDNSLIGSLAAGIAGPLLDFGRIQAQINQADAQSQIAFAAYRRAVFTAIGDSEGAYASVRDADAEWAASTTAAARAARSANLAATRNRAGLSNFLEVLDARRTAEVARDAAASAQGRAMRARVMLWQALGGSALTLPPSAVPR